jgi:hypothetical protein
MTPLGVHIANRTELARYRRKWRRVARDACAGLAGAIAATIAILCLVSS